MAITHQFVSTEPDTGETEKVGPGDWNAEHTLPTAAEVGAAPSNQGVTNGDSHDHSGGDGAQINHAGLANLATGDPHTQYRLESQDHDHSATGLQGGTVSHDVLTGVSANDHHNENHASRHGDGGADEVAVESLPTAETDTGKVLAPDGAGGVEFITPTSSGLSIQFYPQRIKQANDNTDLTATINSTSYVVPASADTFPITFDDVPWTHFKIVIRGRNNEAPAVTTTLQVVTAAGALNGDDLVINTNVLSNFDSGWRTITNPAAHVAATEATLQYKGSNATVDLIYRRIDIVFKYDP